jgi:hypothetical protein
LFLHHAKVVADFVARLLAASGTAHLLLGIEHRRAGKSFDQDLEGEGRTTVAET